MMSVKLSTGSRLGGLCRLHGSARHGRGGHHESHLGLSRRACLVRVGGNVGEEREAEIPANLLDPRNAVHKEFRNVVGRCQRQVHDRLLSHIGFLPAGLVLLLAQKEANHELVNATRYRSHHFVGLIQFVNRLGKQIAKTPTISTCMSRNTHNAMGAV